MCVCVPSFPCPWECLSHLDWPPGLQQGPQGEQALESQLQEAWLCTCCCPPWPHCSGCWWDT